MFSPPMRDWKNMIVTVHLFLTCITAFTPQLLVQRRSSVVGSNKQYPAWLATAHRRHLSSINSGNDLGEDDSSIDMGQLQKRIEQQQNQYFDFIMSDEEDDPIRPDNVYIIVFNPESDEQGVHTVEFPKGSGFNTILAFQSEEECVLFAKMLKQDSMQFYEPVPSETELEALESFCNAMGVPVKVVPKGRGLLPPSDAVDELGFDPNSRNERSKLEDDNDEYESTGPGMWE